MWLVLTVVTLAAVRMALNQSLFDIYAAVGTAGLRAGERIGDSPGFSLEQSGQRAHAR